MCQYPICSPCSLTNTRYFTRFGKIYLPFSYCNSTPRSSPRAHNGVKISICVNNQKFKSFKTPETVWIGLPVTRESDAASLGIWLPTLREGVSFYKEDSNSSRRDNNALRKYRGPSKGNRFTTYYNSSSDVYFTTMAVNDFIRRRGKLIYKHVCLCEIVSKAVDIVFFNIRP